MIWILVVFFPLLLAGLLSIPGLRGMVCRHGPWMACLPALVLALSGPGAQPGVFPSLFLETSLHFGPYGRTFLLLTALLWTAAGAFAGSYFTAKDSSRFRFALFFLLTLCGNLGLCVAQDLASFYVFFALMSFAAYGLIIHDRSEKALRAGRVYLTMTVIGEVLLASAFFYAGSIGLDRPILLFSEIAPALPSHVHGSLILGLAFIGFGIKAGALFLHIWLPLAHPAAPIPASAVLSGAMIKAGLLGWLHLFAPGENMGSALSGACTDWSMTLAWLGLAAALYGVAFGLGKRDPKTILAYSSVSQMGLMTMTLGFTLAPTAAGAEQILSGLLLFVLVHGMAKGFLFLGVGLARAAGRATPRGFLVLAGLGLSSLVLAGLPFTAGSVVKQALKQGATLLPGGCSGLFSAMLPVTATGTSLLLAVFVWRVREQMPEADERIGPGMAAACTGLLGLLLFAAPLAANVLPMEQGLLMTGKHSILDGFWPIGLGLLGAAAFLKSRWSNRDQKGLDDLILESLERALRRLHQRWKASRLCDPACGRIDLVAWSDRILQSRWMRTVPDSLEQRLLYWHTAGVLFIFLLMIFIFTAWQN